MPQEECGGLVAPLGAQIEGPPAFGQRGMLAPSVLYDLVRMFL